jgi:hypothetical protein
VASGQLEEELLPGEMLPLIRVFPAGQNKVCGS